MSFSDLPRSFQEAARWSWRQYAPYFRELMRRPLSAQTLTGWLEDVSNLAAVLLETYNRMRADQLLHTTDLNAANRLDAWMRGIAPYAVIAAHGLVERLRNSGLMADDVALQNLNGVLNTFHPANLPLIAQGQRLITEYEGVIGSQTFVWQGAKYPMAQMPSLWQSADRTGREQLWHARFDSQEADRPRLNAIWAQMLSLRVRIARNASHPPGDLDWLHRLAVSRMPRWLTLSGAMMRTGTAFLRSRRRSGHADYRAMIWQQKFRYAYTPDDCLDFHRAIEQVVVPAVRRLHERNRQALGLESIRPWDLEVEPSGRMPLPPVRDLEGQMAMVFHQLDPDMDAYFSAMRETGMLDLDSRSGKTPGAWNTFFPMVRLPFIAMNVTGTPADISTLLHECGHAFHIFEMTKLPYLHQWMVPAEFQETVAVTMELLAAPHMTVFYNPSEAARVMQKQLERVLIFWAYMAVVDAFQHWVYTYPRQAIDPIRCDAQWSGLWDRYMQGEDWTGLDREKSLLWRYQPHIFTMPFYYIEYGIAWLAAVQIWRRAQEAPEDAITDFKRALSMGGTRTLPELFALAGAEFTFDVNTLADAVAFIEDQIERLEHRI